MKLWINCGGPYQEGWHNIDAMGRRTPLTSCGEGCDGYTLTENQQADVVEIRRVFERLTGEQSGALLASIERSLKSGGVLRLVVARHDESQSLIIKGGDPARLALFGPHWREYTCHMARYSKESLVALVEPYGFIFRGDINTDAPYPNYALEFVKLGDRFARDYALSGIDIPENWITAEIGPGKNEWTRADMYIDIDRANLDRLSQEGKSAVYGDLNGQLPFPNKHFDFLFCAHTLEHVIDPKHAAAEISRVAKSGIVVMPHAFKDSLFLFEEKDHKWWVFRPAYNGGPIRFMKQDPGLMADMADPDYSGTLCNIMRLSPDMARYDHRTMRSWYHRKEPLLDVIVPWKDNLPVEII